MSVRAFVLTAALAALGAAFGHAPAAQAQVNNTTFVRNFIYNQPTVSPYLNLLRRDGIASPNYQTLVRPQIEFRQAAQLQQIELQRLEQQLHVQRASIDAIREQQSQRVFNTGHTTRFMNTGGFYPGFSQSPRGVR